MSDGADFPWFLQRLALDSKADQRAIRRAYAREVKRIDQGADPHGFQLLREAYETALRWEEYQRYCPPEAMGDIGAADGAPATASEGSPASGAGPACTAEAPAPAQSAPGSNLPGSEPPVETATRSGATDSSPASVPDDALPGLAADPHQLSADVFEAFIAGCSGLAQGRTLHDAAAWELHLRTCLNDDRLMNLAARAIFEARVLHLLAGGWRPGHETLLEAASDVFQWRSDRHRLLRFGHAGAIVDRAIDERSMFDNQDRETRAFQRQVMLRLRESDPPDPGQLRADLPHAEQLAARFPTWLELVASMDTLEQWRSQYAALPALAPPGYGDAPLHWNSGNLPAWGQPAQAAAQAPQVEGVDHVKEHGGADAGPGPMERIKRFGKRFLLGFVAFNAALLLVRILTIGEPAPPPSPQPSPSSERLDADYAELMARYEAHRMEREAREAKQAEEARARAQRQAGPPQLEPDSN